MSEIRKWLEAIGLGQYADAFEVNKIDMDLLAQVDAQILKDIGVSAAGDRLRIRNAIAKLATAPTAEVNVSATTPLWETTVASAERRQLTVMFCDLVGSTALSARLDPEDLRSIIGAYHRCCTDQVERNGGFVAKYMGDGVLAYFGYPQAHEHDAERAVRAGLDLVAAVPKLETVAGSHLQARVGIATGLVVVGELIGSGEAQERGVVGETPNLAARLQALAEPGAVVIASSTWRLTGGLFEYRDLGSVALKGLSKNVSARQVLGISVAESRFEAMRSAMTPLVGRDEEIDLLLRRWKHAKGGDGQVVLISGEPGIGKSRIAQTVVERIGTEPHTRLRYFCSPHHQDSALYPSIAQLERAAGLRRDDTPEQRLAKLEAVLADGTNDLREAVPLLADLLSIPTGDRYPPLNLTPQKRKDRTLHAQLAQVEGLAARQPVLMVFEDVHWSDATTRESLDLLVDRVAMLRVLVIITFRPEFAPPWIGRPHVTMLNLNRLPPRQRAEMIAYVTGGRALPKEIAEQIVDRTDGVPLFIEELTKSVIESSIVTETGDHYAPIDPVAPLAIPTSLHASLLARLDRLAPTREVAQVGAALGRQFSHELISAVAMIPQQQLDDSLAQLVHAELIFRRGTPPNAEYTFKHALVQDAAYSTLLRSRRQQIHGRIAATMEGQFPEITAAQPAVVAQHCAEAGLTEKAIGYWLKAGQQAVARSAMKEAVAALQKGLETLALLPKDTSSREQELDLLIAIGPALIATRGYANPAVGETYGRARTIAEQLDRPTDLLAILYGQWVFHNNRIELEPARLLAQQAEKLGYDRSDGTTLFFGHWLHGIVRYELGEFEQARALFEQCRSIDRPTTHVGHAPVTAEDPHSVMLAYLAIVLNRLGYFNQARLWIREALSAVHQSNHAYSLAFVLNMAYQVEWITGSARETLQYADRLVALSNEHGFAHWLGLGTALRGRSMSALGQTNEGLALVMKGHPLLRSTGSILSGFTVLMLLAETHLELGRLEEGLSCLVESAEIVRTTGLRHLEANLYRSRGDLLSAKNDLPAAEESYQQAIMIAQRQSAKTFELRAATSLARLWRDQGKRTEARDLLAPVYGWFTEGFDTPVLQDAKVLLDELAS
jgi:class 3 adenylate cyclase/tetratricopeptide (TPR) repeat protein